MTPRVSKSDERGFSMVESMVALLVLSVGMLGIAALYVTSLRASGSALYRTQAINLAADMADRIRTNPDAGAAYAGAAASNNCSGTGSVSCSRTALAADDLFRWQAQISTALPDNDGNAGTPQGTVVVVGGATPRTYTITVNWSEPGDNQALNYVLMMQI